MNKKYRFYWLYKGFSTIPPKRLLILLLYSVLIFILFAIAMFILTFKQYGVWPLFESGVSAQYDFGNSGRLFTSYANAEDRNPMSKVVLVLISFSVGSVFLLVYFRIIPLRNDETDDEVCYRKDKKMILFISVVLYIVCLLELFL